MERYGHRKKSDCAPQTIRKHARLVFAESDEPKECCECGYSRHVEVSHIKDISEFSDDALLEEINSINNLLGLCPTHHWEFDNGFLKLENISRE